MFSFLGFNSASTSNQPNNPSTSNTDSNEDPPMFPAQNSIQRASSSKPQSSTPSFQISEAEDDENDSDEDLPGAFPSNLSDFDSLPPPTSTVVKPPALRKKVKLQPGFSQLDWAKLKSSGKNLRGEGIFSIRRISRDELAQHNRKDDAWSSFHGKVYNITPYLNYHPGGVPELMRVAGKDGTELFMKTHAWINADGMMDCCLIGFLVN